MTLKFYDFGIMLHRTHDDGSETEYPIDPAQLASVLAARVELNTGLLTGNTIYIATQGIKRLVVEYRPPQKTGIFLDGSTNAIRIPMPGLLLFRAGAETPRYALYAVKKRPDTMDTPLYHAPLPNIYQQGNICWGTVNRVSKDGLASNHLDEDWKLLLGSSFGNHGVPNRSKSHPKDIREKYAAMEARKTRTYPTTDLIKTDKTLAQVIKDMLK